MRESSFPATIRGLGNTCICARLLLPEQSCNFFIRIFLRFWLAGLKVLMTFMNDLQSKAIVKQFIVFYG